MHPIDYVQLFVLVLTGALAGVYYARVMDPDHFGVLGSAVIGAIGGVVIGLGLDAAIITIANSNLLAGGTLAADPMAGATMKFLKLMSPDARNLRLDAIFIYGNASVVAPVLAKSLLFGGLGGAGIMVVSLHHPLQH